MANFPDYTNLTVAQEAKNYFRDVVLFDNVEEAHTFIVNYSNYLKTNPNYSINYPKPAEIYNEIYNQAKLVSLDRLKDDEIVDLFQYHFVDQYNLSGPIDLLSKLRAKLLQILELPERDKLKKRLLEALNKNNQVLTTENLEIDDRLMVGTVANWIKDMEQALGRGKYEALAFNDYLINGRNTKKISDDSRNRLRVFFSLVERLKLSSLTSEGLEETFVVKVNDELKTVKEGKIESLENDEKLKEIANRAVNLWNEYYGIKDEAKVEVEAEAEVNPAVVEPNISSRNIEQKPIVLYKTPQALKQPTPAFLFDEADEKEVDKHRIKNQELGIKNEDSLGTLEQKLREMAEEVVKEHNFSFKDEVSHKRFVQLFVSFLKDVRDVIEAREMLLKGTDSGGLGLTSDKAEKIIVILQQAKKEFESRIKNQELGIGAGEQILKQVQNDGIKSKTELDKIIEAEAAAVKSLTSQKEFGMGAGENILKQVQDDKAGFAKDDGKKQETFPRKSSELDGAQHLIQNDKQEQNDRKEQDSKVKQKIEELVKEIPAKSEVEKFKNALTPEDLESTRQQILQEIVGKISTEKAATLHSAQNGVPTGLKQGSVQRSKIMDVKAPPRILGPIEELRTLSMLDFRRLSDNPVEALQKLQKKIDIIGETSVGKKVEAIRAWQASPVYQLYLKVGRASIESGKSIAAVISDLLTQKEMVLDEDEFNAIVDFNERIRF